jgi:hypothetical protein
MKSFKPLLAFTISPKTLFLDACVVTVVTNSALFAFYPSSIVFSAVLPQETALTMSLILLELTNILLTIRPNQVSLPVHLVVQPVAFILFVVAP